MNNNKKYILALKYTIYALLLLLLYVLQTTPGFLTIHGAKPILVVSAAVSIAMLEGEFIGGIYGAAAGILCDVSGFSLFGFNGFFICGSCVAVGLLIIYLMRCNLFNCMLFVFVALMVRGSVEYLFAYGMWDYENVWMIYVYHTLPTVALSLVVTPLIFWGLRKIHGKFEAVLEP